MRDVSDVDLASWWVSDLCPSMNFSYLQERHLKTLLVDMTVLLLTLHTDVCIGRRRKKNSSAQINKNIPLELMRQCVGAKYLRRYATSPRPFRGEESQPRTNSAPLSASSETFGLFDDKNVSGREGRGGGGKGHVVVLEGT